MSTFRALVARGSWRLVASWPGMGYGTSVPGRVVAGHMFSLRAEMYSSVVQCRLPLRGEKREEKHVAIIIFQLFCRSGRRASVHVLRNFTIPVG